MRKQKLYEKHETDAQGNPTGGGTTEAVGLQIQWQDHPHAAVTASSAPEGASVEEVVRAAIGRLQWLQGHFTCRENAVALTHLETALLWLQKRAADVEAGLGGPAEK